MKAAVITTNNASLNTVQITIQALCVSGKQMTLSVFRQLPISDPAEESALWGTVRYKIKDEGDVWLVHSFGDILYRFELLPADMLRCSNRYVIAAEEKVHQKRASVAHNLARNDDYWLARSEQDLKDALDEYNNVLCDYEDRMEYVNGMNSLKQRAAELPQLFISI